MLRSIENIYNLVLDLEQLKRKTPDTEEEIEIAKHEYDVLLSDLWREMRVKEEVEHGCVVSKFVLRTRF